MNAMLKLQWVVMLKLVAMYFSIYMYGECISSLQNIKISSNSTVLDIVQLAIIIISITLFSVIAAFFTGCTMGTRLILAYTGHL